MTRDAVRYAVTAVALNLLLAMVNGPLRQRVPIEAHLAVVGGLALVAVVQAVADRCDVAAWRAPALVTRRPPPPSGPVPEGLGQWVGVVTGATEDGRAAAARLAPRLATLAGDRLASRRGIDSGTDRPAAEAALGSVASRLVWPGAVPDRWSPGVALSDVTATADALEDLG